MSCRVSVIALAVTRCDRSMERVCGPKMASTPAEQAAAVGFVALLLAVLVCVVRVKNPCDEVQASATTTDEGCDFQHVLCTSTAVLEFIVKNVILGRGCNWYHEPPCADPSSPVFASDKRSVLGNDVVTPTSTSTPAILLALMQPVPRVSPRLGTCQSSCPCRARASQGAAQSKKPPRRPHPSPWMSTSLARTKEQGR